MVAYAVSGSGPEPRVGLVVSKAVGNAVVRNQVKRRLRHLMLGRLADLRDPRGEPRDLVLRALPAAGSASSARLADDLGLVLAKVAVR